MKGHNHGTCKKCGKFHRTNTGYPAWNKGRKIPKDELMKLRANGFGFKMGKASWLKGKHHKKESNELNRLKHLGKKHSDETKRKMSIARGKYLQTHPMMCLGKDTYIEVILQNFLKELDIKFETNKEMLGHPDIFIKPNICVFADGCYFHNCPTCGYDVNRMPEKIRMSRVRDVLVTEKLIRDGYVVLRLWEHEIKEMFLEEFENKLKEVNYVPTKS